MMDGDISIYMIASEASLPSVRPGWCRSVKHSDLISGASLVFRPNSESTLKENLGCIFIVLVSVG